MVAPDDERQEQLKAQLVQFQAKLRQEKMIHDTIIRIQNHYTEPEGIRKAQDKLAESEKRLKYLQREIDGIMRELEPESRGKKLDEVTQGQIEGSAVMIEGPLDYWKPMGCLTSEALEFKLAELLYKLHIEEKIRFGSLNYIKAISDLPATSADKIKETIRAAHESLEQCQAKIQILTTAIKSYQSLMIDRPFGPFHDDSESGFVGEDGEQAKPVPFTGRLTVKVFEVSKCSMDDGASLIATCLIDGHERFTQKLKRFEKCQLDTDGVTIDLKGSSPLGYFELLIRTKEMQAVGFLFFKLMWMGNGDSPFKSSELLSLEPDGLVSLEIKYEPTMTAEKEDDEVEMSSMGRLVRHNAIQRKKVEKLGHQLYPKKYYQLLKCAVCHEFLYQTSAYQCDLCKFFCHKKCAELILTKCVSATDLELEGHNPLAHIRYNVEHNFSDMQSLMPAWCMHCGKFGRKDFIKCKECENVCHKKCAHNIPNYCGMPTSLPELAALRLSGESRRPSTVASPTTAESSQLASPHDSIKNYEGLKLLGRGNFGKVVLARHIPTDTLVAIKSIKKAVAMENNELENIEVELEIFRVAGLESHPFLVQLRSFFSDSTHFYFVMEYIVGGDLMFHIQKRKFTPDEARYFAAEVLLALEYLHKHNIIYRDLKLDNIMLSADGHVKLTDFGLCKPRMEWDSQTGTFCGTPEFIAPEILSEKSYTRAVDWWAFGVLLYELILGQSPFSGRTETEIFKSIMQGRFYFKPNVSQDAKDLILRLLTRNPKLRLGSGPTDAAAIKKHAYFKGIDFNRLIMKLDKAPFLPLIRSPSDAANFDPVFTNESPDLSPSPSLALS